MGLIFDIIDSVLGSNNGPSNNGFNQEIWDSFNEKLTDALDSDKFEEAESLIKTYYKEYETERDFYYYWYRACTYVRWLESFDASLGIETVKKLQNKAVDALRQSAKFAYDENSDTGNVSEVEELQERYEKVTKEWDDFLSGVDGYNQLQTELDKLIEQQDYIQANSILEEYYIRPSNEKNVDYYYYKTFIQFKLFCEIPADSDKLSSSRQSLDEILKQYGTACKEQNEIDTYLFVKQRVHSEEADKEIGRHLCGGKYKKAFDVAKDYKNLEPKDEYEYYSKIRWIYQWQWEATPVYWKNYTQIENKVIESYNDWQNYCTTDDELDYYNHCYNEDFLRVKNEKEKEKKEWAKSASEYRQGTIEEGPLVIGNDGTSDNMIDDSSIPSESLYKQEVLLILQDGSIGDVERKFLERKRTKLGLTKEQAQKIEASCTVSLTDEEQEYVSIYRDLVEDGEPTGRLRKMLDREAEALGLSPERVSEIERTL